MRRWAVAFISSDIGGEWACYKNQDKKYFNSEKDAENFAEQFKYKGKPWYWQPTIWCEESFETVTNEMGEKEE